MAGELNNKDTIFTILTAIVKKNGGEFRITEEELCDVKTTALVTLLWDGKTNEVVLQTNSTTASMVTKPPEGYDN